MASIHIPSLDLTLEASPAVSILNTLLRNGVFINHLCGGKAGCGTCQIRILKGREFLSPIGEGERLRLQSVKAPQQIRLACQTHTYGPIEIEVRFKKSLKNH